MNKDMKVKAWWLMRVGLLLAVVLAGSAGCERPAECDKLEVVCADELQNETFSDDKVRIVRFFQATNAIKKIEFDAKLYNFHTTCVYENGKPGEALEIPSPELINQGNHQKSHAFLVTLNALPLKCQIKVSDKNPLFGTSQTYEFCGSLTSTSQTCSEFKQQTVQLSKDSAAKIAVNVSCLRLTYREIEKGIDPAKGNAKFVWGDMTWLVKAAGQKYDMVGAPSVSGYHYAEPSGPFLSGKGDVEEMLGPAASKSKPVTSLESNKAAELRLPLRGGYGKLVNVAASNESVLQAGWYVALDKGKAVNIGCSIKQTKLASILDTALKSKPVGDQTVHILFNEDAPKGQLVGEHGWCYGLTKKDAATPLFKPHSTEKTGELCIAL